MKKSIILAILIFLVTVIWLISGQLDNVNAVDGELSISSENLKIEPITKVGKNNIIKVESKKYYAQQIDQSIIIQGQTTYNKKIDVKAETIGNITKIYFKRGDKVKKGQPLIEISKEDRFELINSSKELIKLYEIEYSSTKQLIIKGLSSKSKLGLAAYNLANAKSQLKNIKLDMDNTSIVSPFNGIITNKNVEITDYVTPGNILLTIVNLDPIKVQGYLSELDINKVNIETEATIENSNGNKKNGRIVFISPLAETATRTFEIEIEADNSDLTFKSGITTSIIIKGTKLLAHKIPPSILTLQDDGTIGVKTLNDKNVVVFYPIQKVMDTIDGMWVSGLPNDVNLIISGQEYVSAGQIIELQ